MTHAEQRAACAIIAERICGWTHVGFHGVFEYFVGVDPLGTQGKILDYFGDEAANGALRDKLRLRAQCFVIMGSNLERWHVRGFHGNILLKAEHSNLKTALCLFALAWIERQK